MKPITYWLSFAICYTCLPLYAVTNEWTEQLGSSGDDSSYAVSADGQGNVYITGSTRGDLGGSNAGSSDAFLSKYDASGTLLWTEQLGSMSGDLSFGVSADGLGNVYISGETSGDLGGNNAGSADAFVSKYDASGTLLWTEQLGSSASLSTSSDISHGVSADGLGNVYISGSTDGELGGNNDGSLDAFVSKYDTSGTLLWTEQLGSTSYAYERSYGVSADGLGNVYISGITLGDLGGINAGNEDAFVSKYDASGTLLWTEQLGSTSTDVGYGVSADGLGNVYISGITLGDLGGINAGSLDAFVSKYDASGTLLWTEQLGSMNSDLSFGVSADGLGNVYISGKTSGDLGGNNAGSADAFVSKYDASGTFLWTKQLGSTGNDISRGVSADGLGNVYISGYTSGKLGENNPAGSDAFVAKFSETTVPEPSSVFLTGIILVAISCSSHRSIVR